jgi:hypothetical protein
MDPTAMRLPLRALFPRLPAALLGICVYLFSSSARASSLDVACSGMPPNVATDLRDRASARLANSPANRGNLRLDCDSAGVWLTWFDGSRAAVDQSSGVVAGVLALIDGRLAQESAAAPPPAGPPPEPTPSAVPGPGVGMPTPGAPDAMPAPQNAPSTAPDPLVYGDHELPPPEEQDSLSEGLEMPTEVHRYHGPQGGIGFALMTEFLSGSTTVGTGPRLDVSIGPPGPFAIVLGEGTLLGLGEGTSNLLMIDFQAGFAVGAPYKTRRGLGAVLLFGAERMSGSSGDAPGQSKWTGLFDLGARASLSVAKTNLWLGIDGILRSTDFETGPPDPVRVASASFMFEIGCFLPAIEAETAP